MPSPSNTDTVTVFIELVNYIEALATFEQVVLGNLFASTILAGLQMLHSFYYYVLIRGLHRFKLFALN